jgi:hypothetical protein
MPKRGVARIFLFAMSLCVAQAQIPSRSLNGLVTGPKDAVITGAHVTAVITLADPAGVPMDIAKEPMVASLVYPKERSWAARNPRCCRERWT